MKTAIRMLVAVIAGLTALASLTLPAGGEIVVTSDTREADPGRSTTSNVIDNVRTISDGPKIDSWSRGCNGFCYDHDTIEWDFGAAAAVARCRQVTSTSSGGTATTCSPGQGEWVPQSAATVSYFHDGGAIRARLEGVLSVHQAGDPFACNVSAVRVDFRYADGGTDSSQSPCGRVNNPVSLVSTPGRDAVQVQVFAPASCGCIPGDLILSDVLGEGRDILDVDELRLTSAGQPLLSNTQVQWHLGTLQDGQQVNAVSPPPPWRPVLSTVGGTFLGRHFDNCGPTFLRQTSRLVLRWAHVVQPTASVYARSGAVAEGSSLSFTLTNPALNLDNGQPANPFEVHASIEVSTDGGRSWSACGGESWVKLGDV
jgi:hypothetical protein